jgi:hypothetical protein
MANVIGMSEEAIIRKSIEILRDMVKDIDPAELEKMGNIPLSMGERTF